MLIRSSRLESTTFLTHLQSPDQLYFQINRRGNDSCQFNGTGFTNRFPVCQIAKTKDESTLVGCIGQPSWWEENVLTNAPSLLPISRHFHKFGQNINIYRKLFLLIFMMLLARVFIILKCPYCQNFLFSHLIPHFMQ